MDTDTNNLESLLVQRKFDEAGRVIRANVQKDMSEKEKGAMFAGLAEAYINISNAFNFRYKQALEETIKIVEELNVAEAKINDRIKLTEVRQALN